jgi:hypothetical protein
MVVLGAGVPTSGRSVAQASAVEAKRVCEAVAALREACRALPAERRCVSIFLDKNRRYVGKSQPKRPPKRAQRRAPAERPAGRGLARGPTLPDHRATIEPLSVGAAGAAGAVRLGHPPLGRLCLALDEPHPAPRVARALRTRRPARVAGLVPACARLRYFVTSTGVT